MIYILHDLGTNPDTFHELEKAVQVIRDNTGEQVTFSSNDTWFIQAVVNRGFHEATMVLIAQPTLMEFDSIDDFAQHISARASKLGVAVAVLKDLTLTSIQQALMEAG